MLHLKEDESKITTNIARWKPIKIKMTELCAKLRLVSNASSYKYQYNITSHAAR